jgi:vancomycin resistance protein YoaR
MGDTTRLAVETPERHVGSAIRHVIVVVLIAAVAVGYIWLAHWLAIRVPAGVTVSGVDISHLTGDEAVEKLEAELGDRAGRPIEVAVGDATATLDPAKAGLTFSPAETVAPLLGLTYDPFDLWRHAAGAEEVPAATQVDRAALEAAVTALADETAVAAVDGTVSVRDGRVTTTEPVAGSRVDVEAAADQVAADWFDATEPIDLTVAEVAPDVDEAALEQARAEIAEPLLSGPVVVAVEDRRIELPVTVLAEAASISPINGTLRLDLNEDVIVEAVKDRLPADIESAAQDAKFVFVDGKPTIEPGTAGRSVDFASITAEVALAAQATGERTAVATMREIDPAQSTELLESMGINEVVGTWTTVADPIPNRTANIALAAEKVTGILVQPGETFSLNDTLGPRTSENGWHTAGVVENGVLTEGMGGGLSQFSTTLYNATHLAGLEDVEHQPHRNYFSRYPKGREATLWEGVIDNKFKNTTPYGVLLRAWVAEDLKVTVEVWSTKYWEVESVIGEAYNTVPTKTITRPAGAGCEEQAAGSPGFTVDYTRTLKLNGELKEEKTWTWTYSPTNKYVCESAKSEEEEED